MTGVVTTEQLISVAISALIAKYAERARGVGLKKRHLLYEQAEQQIYRLNPTPDEYEAAVKLLSRALKI